MKGIKLTPLNMFLLLVLVLIISIFIGYSVKETFKEGATTMNSNASTNTYAPYSSTRKLVAIHDKNGAEGSIYFDPITGSMVNVFSGSGSSSGDDSGDSSDPDSNNEVTLEADSETMFVVVNRDGSSQSYNSNLDASTLSNMSSIENYPQKENWSYDHFGVSVVYITWKNQTVIYLLDNTNNVVLNTFVSHFTSETTTETMVDSSINGSPLPTQNSTTVSSTLSGNTSTNSVNGVTVSQISENVYFNYDKGIYIQTSNGFKHSHDKNTNSGSISLYDNENQRAIFATRFSMNGSPVAVVVIITKNNGILEINTTVRVDKNGTSGQDSSNGQNSSDGQGSSNDDNDDCGNTGDYSNDYILKTQVVPPVCPMCPTQCDNVPSKSQGCSVTVNDQGQLVDCNGNIINPNNGGSQNNDSVSPGGSSGSYAPYSMGQGLSDTVQTVGNTVDNTVSSATDLASSTVGTAGSIVDQGLSTAGDAVTGVTKDVTGVISDLGDDVSNILGKGIDSATGLASQTVGSATGLTSQAMDTGANLLYNTGSGVYDLAQQGIYRDPYGVYRNAYGQPVPLDPNYIMQPTYPGTPVYPTGRYQGYGTCNMPYPMEQSGYNVMPITNDFSQFT